MNLFEKLLKIIFVDFRFFIALGIRLIIIFISEIILPKYNINYTDIDYHVFSDGAKHILNFESPYNRETYRYTPILAMMMLPNHLINYNFGKILFSVVDILIGISIEILLIIQNNRKILIREEKEEYLSYLYKFLNNPYSKISLLFLYNPIIINISTRGSSDCIIVLLVIITLILIEMKYICLGAFFYGFAIHFKIYPVIYAPALFLYIAYKDNRLTDKNSLNEDNNSSTIKIFSTKLLSIIKSIFRSVFHFKSIIFAFIFIVTFLTFLGFFYLIYGYKFLYEFLLYHVIRKDHRHNYSIFYYLIYLTYTQPISKLLSLILFAPQMLLTLLSNFILFKDINFSLFITTMIFVTFNKVVTAQYFIWYIAIIPLIINRNKLFNINQHPSKVLYFIIIFIFWLFMVLYWNSLSHRLEYLGENLFSELWGLNIIFFLTNCWIIKEFISNHTAKYNYPRQINY